MKIKELAKEIVLKKEWEKYETVEPGLFSWNGHVFPLNATTYVWLMWHCHPSGVHIICSPIIREKRKTRWERFCKWVKGFFNK